MRAIHQVNGTGTKDGKTALNKVTGQGDQVNKAKIHAAITLLNRGVSWIYYGDELGMSSNTDQHVAMYGSENCEDIWYRQPFLWHDTSVRANYKSGAYKFELDDYNKTLADAEAQQADPNSMYNWYKGLIAIKKMYPKDARLSFTDSSNNVLVLEVTGASTSLRIFINVGTGSNQYIIKPVGYTNVYTLGGAPSTAGGDIGATMWSVSVFKK
jgi:glycosidase